MDWWDVQCAFLQLHRFPCFKTDLFTHAAASTTILQYYVQDRRCERFALLVKISHGLLFKQVFLHTGIINDTFQFQQHDHSCKNKCLAWKKVHYLRGFSNNFVLLWYEQRRYEDISFFTISVFSKNTFRYSRTRWRLWDSLNLREAVDKLPPFLISTCVLTE